MSAALSDDLKEYLDDNPVFATVATVQPDGSPQLSVVWIKRDGDDLLISTTVGRRKERNLRRDPRVTVMINPGTSRTPMPRSAAPRLSPPRVVKT